MNGIIPEMEQIISQLERGTVVTKFFSRKRPEKKTLMIRRETRQIVWSRSTTFRPFDGSGKILSFDYFKRIILMLFICWIGSIKCCLLLHILILNIYL